MSDPNMYEPLIGRWYQCMAQIDESASLSLIAHDTLVACIREDRAAAVQAEREALQPVTDLWQFIRENGSCMSGSDNRPCRLNDSDDPKEYCLYHMAWDIRASTTKEGGDELIVTSSEAAT